MDIMVEPDGVIYTRLMASTGIHFSRVDTSTNFNRTTLLIGALRLTTVRPILFRKSGVIHGDPEVGEGGFYPLHLLFSRESYRQTVAKKESHKAPDGRWVARTRTRVMELLGFADFYSKFTDKEYMKSMRTLIASDFIEMQGCVDFREDMTKELSQNGWVILRKEKWEGPIIGVASTTWAAERKLRRRIVKRSCGIYHEAVAA